MPVDSYRSISTPASFEIAKTKGSRFLGDAFPVSNESFVRSCIDEVRLREHAAHHHCYAFRLGPDGHLSRTSDAGEPSGSAGEPIMREIESRSLTNTLVVVSRYFGGTRLGVGGLVRAYSAAAGAVLDAAAITEWTRMSRLGLTHAYPHTGNVERVLEKFGAVVDNRHFAAEVTFEIWIRNADESRFRRALRDATNGSVRFAASAGDTYKPV